MKCWTFFIFLVLTFGVFSVTGQLLFPQDETHPPRFCKTPSGGQGTCQEYKSCPIGKHELYVRAHCGLYGGIFYVCCPEKKSEDLTSPNAVPSPLISFECGRRGTTLIDSELLAPPLFSEVFARRSKRSSIPDPTLEDLDLTVFPAVVGGFISTANSWPWMILLGRRRGPTNQYFCSAVLINERFALTAAHCLLDPTPFFARLGEHDYSQGLPSDPVTVEDVDIQEVKFHPNYDRNLGYNDFAIIKLVRDVSFRNEVKPVCLPWGKLGTENLVGEVVTIAGWGSEQFGGGGSPVLREVSVTVFDPSTCEKSYSTLPGYSKDFPQGLTQNNIVCAGNTLGGKDSCQGDSGGPLVHFETGEFYSLAGIVSRGYGCGKQDFPGLYAPIRNYETLNWIKESAFS